MLADVLLSFYIGASQTQPSDLRVQQPAHRNDVTVHSVTWRGYPFRFEIYYGIRLAYTPPYHPWTQLVLDYTHYKVYAETDDTVLQSIEMTHGLNMLAVNVLQRVVGGANTSADIDGAAHTSGYDFGGTGFQVIAGANGCAGSHQLFAEMKYSNGTPLVAIAQGRAQTALHTVHELAGVQFGHCR